MTTTRSTRATLPQYRRVTLVPDTNGSVVATYHWTVYRFMFSDGETLDVRAVRDDSDLRGEVLRHHFGKQINDPKDGSIVGVATLPSEEKAEAPPTKRPTKRVAKQPTSG